MKRLFLVAILSTITFIFITLFRAPVNAQSSMCSLESLPSLPDVTISSVTEETDFAPHCKVAGVIGPEINFELRLPNEWNGKFVMGGGGGFVGFVINTALDYGALQSGYATVGTDTGHQGHPIDASWALNNMERIVNFGHQAVHRTAVTAKALIEKYYGQNIAKSYFIGCSRGGGQALMEAQRYPEDFDGIVAGAPAQYWTDGLGAGTTVINQAMYPDPSNLKQAVIGSEQQELIGAAILARCDGLDGIEDGILNDPRQCDFDVATLICEAGDTEGCLTAAQIDAVKAIYDGPKDEQGNSLFYGFPFGGETDPNGWASWLTGGLIYAQDDNFQEGIEIDESLTAPVAPSKHYAFGQGVMKYLIYHDPDWSYTNYDFSTFREDAKLAAETLDATDPNLSPFREHGGKLLMYTGWSDMAITPLGTIAYYDDVLAEDATAVDDVRFFLMPGVDHCIGGRGPSWVNFLDEIDKWVMTDTAPIEMTAYWVDEQFNPTGSRLICAYPQVAEYDGEGDTRDVSSFSCVQGD